MPCSPSLAQGAARVLIPVRCLSGPHAQVTKRGQTATGTQRSRCHHPDCPPPSVRLDPASTVEGGSSRVDAATGDALGSLVGKQTAHSWLWHAIAHGRGRGWASVCGRRQDEVCGEFKVLVAPVGLTRFYTAHGGVSHVTSTRQASSQASATHTKSSGNLCRDGPGASGWCARRSACRKPAPCRPLFLDWMSSAVHLDG